jgi:hypothetical protein
VHGFAIIAKKPQQQACRCWRRYMKERFMRKLFLLLLLMPALALAGNQKLWGGNEVYVLTVDMNAAPKNTFSFVPERFKKNNQFKLITVLSSKSGSPKGIHPEFIVGYLKPDTNEIKNESFGQNVLFKQLIQKMAVNLYFEKASKFLKKNPEKPYLVVDERFSGKIGQAKESDVIVSFIYDKNRGVLFDTNPNYLLVSSDGIACFTLDISNELSGLVRKFSI